MKSMIHHHLKLFSGKKGMEMWQLVIIILAVVFLLFMLAWYFFLDQDLNGLTNTFTELF